MRQLPAFPEPPRGSFYGGLSCFGSSLYERRLPVHSTTNAEAVLPLAASLIKYLRFRLITSTQTGSYIALARDVGLLNSRAHCKRGYGEFYDADS